MTLFEAFLKSKRSELVFLYGFVNGFGKRRYFSRYILLTDQSSLPDCLYFLRYYRICDALRDLVLFVQFFKLYKRHQIAQRTTHMYCN